MQDVTTVSVGQETAPPPSLAPELHRQHLSGAQLFFWVAALSVVNTLIGLSGSDWSFIIGLGITQMIDGVVAVIKPELAAGTATVLPIVALLLDLIITGLFILFGWLAKQGYTWSFIIGMVFYEFDGLIFLLAGDWLSTAFHVFALWGMFKGLQALRQFKQLTRA